MIELNKIFCEDCLEGMKRIPDESIDCIICDLPYGTTKNKWDSVIPLDKLWEQYRRIIKKRGAIVLFAQVPFNILLGMSGYSMLKYEWVWEKELATGFLNAGYAPMKCHENIMVFSKSAACYVKSADNAMIFNPQKTEGKPYVSLHKGLSGNYDKKWQKDVATYNDGDRHPTDVLRFARDKDAWHPTQKPLDLIRYLILTYTNEGNTVLDNCIGSGTTAIACIKEKRNFIGFELNKDYYDKACKRIRNEQRQLTLF